VEFGFITITMILTNKGDALHFSPARAAVLSTKAVWG